MENEVNDRYCESKHFDGMVEAFMDSQAKLLAANNKNTELKKLIRKQSEEYKQI